jgi:uncharacterized protein YeaO (DUF488 family)
MGIKTKNVYDPLSPGDGWRLLVMRKWPRGVPKQMVHTWDRDLGPTTSLLKCWRQGKMDWDTFYSQNEGEMLGQEERLRALAARAQMEMVTLLCGCRDEGRCHRSVLKRLVEQFMA